MFIRDAPHSIDPYARRLITLSSVFFDLPFSIVKHVLITNLAYSDVCKIILAIFLPPVGVFLERGCNADLLINIVLTFLGYIPGIIHAL